MIRHVSLSSQLITFFSRQQSESDTIDPYSWDEKNKLESVIENHYPRWYPFSLNALRTGLRISEFVALKPEDLNFEEMFIEVNLT